MAGVQASPRSPAGAVPMLNTQAIKSSPLMGLNDEVAAILNGLQLNKQWFQDRIRPEQKMQLLPQNTMDLSSSGTVGGKLESSRRGSAMGGGRPARRRPKAQEVSKTADFDIYLNEAVMPVLAQSLDALCRQLARMKEQGDRLDPKVRARFNPLTWLAQQLLRRHPKCARTPRRQLLYRGFKDWADIEKGRRELLRRRHKIEEVFQGFMLRGVVQHDRIDLVLNDVDEAMHLQGLLKNNQELAEILAEAKRLPGMQRNLTVPAASSMRRGSLMFEGKSWSFEEFWFHFANAVWKCEVVPYSAILRGEERQKQVDQERRDFEERQAAADAEREQMEEEKRRLIGKYNDLYERLIEDPMLKEISNGDKILSGDDVRPGDVGYEFEAPPHGPHVALLSEFMKLLGLDVSRQAMDELAENSQQSQQVGEQKTGFFRSSAKAKNIEHAEDDEEYWDDTLARAWSVVQRAHHAEADDGVVDGEVLKQVIVPPSGFDMMRAKVEYEMEQHTGEFLSEAEPSREFAAGVGMEKPSMEQLCLRLGMTMSRLEWLHALFETFLVPEDPNDPDAPPPCCMYPECPASINKEQMRALVNEVEPGLSKAQFEARFKRLDQDGSGLIEFDEFAYWVHSSGVRVTGKHQVKMSHQELANRYQEPVALIQYVHGCFQDQLPEGVVDGYPKKPVGLPKEDARVLAQILTPGLDEAVFDEAFELVDETSRQRGHCDFDEFLELLELDDLPAELRDRFDVEENGSGLSDGEEN